MTTQTATQICCPTPARRSVSVLRWLVLMFAAARQRRKLASLDAHMLRDIGLSQDCAQREIRRKPWDVPAHWLQ